MGLLCLDLDGTLVENALIEVDGKLQRPQTNVYVEPMLMPRRVQVVQRAAEEGDRFAIVTNQAGVAWGFHTVAEVMQRIGCAIGQLGFFFGAPFTVHYSLTHPRATVSQFRGEDERRKPGGGMILEAMRAHGVECDETLMVGDLGEDEGAAEAASVSFAPADQFFEL
jgi:D-glycero-D-manno-heptose 1,7-bisphosphate phosphatase